MSENRMSPICDTAVAGGLARWTDLSFGQTRGSGAAEAGGRTSVAHAHGPGGVEALHTRTDAGGAEWYLSFALAGLHATISLHFEVVHAEGHRVQSGSPRDRKYREKGERCRCQTKTRSKDRRQTRTHRASHRQAAKAFHSRRRPFSPRTRAPSPKDRRRPPRATEAPSRSPAE